MFRQVDFVEVGKSLKQHKCDVSIDKWAGEVSIRIQGAVSDLHVADARYHLNCRHRFVSESSVRAAATTSSSVSSDSDEAFVHVIKIMEDNMSKLWELC